MKKILTLAMLFAAAATAFVSCSKDETADMKPSIELSGKTKSITLSSSIATTRTELDGHNLKWVNGDTFGIFYVGEDGSSILGYVESPAYEEGTTAYTLADVPEETKYFYCVYPYDADHIDTEDLKAVACHIPDSDNMKKDYKFNGKQHLMAAKAEIAEDDTVAVTFSPLVSILEFNIYDTESIYESYYFSSLRIDTDENCSGDCTVDFTGETPTLNDLNHSYIYADCNIWNEKVSIPSAREDGVKVYALIAPGKYDSFDLWFKLTKDEYEMNTTECKFSYGSVTISAFGHTLNVDLSNQPLNLIDYAVLTQRGPWTVYLDVTPTEDCEKYVVAAFPTTSSTNSEGDQMTDGWDVNEAKFAEIAERCFLTYSSGFGMLQYMVYTGTQKIYQDYFVYDGYPNNGEWNEPKGLRINEDVEEYTVAIYAVNATGGSQVVTRTFKPNACTQSTDAGPKIESISNTFTGGSATITANAALATYIFYGTSTTGAPTFDDVKTMFKEGEGTFVANPKSAITVDFTRYNSETVYVWALETAYLGGISKVTTLEFAPAEISYDGSAKVLTFEGTTFTKGMEDQTDDDGKEKPCLWGDMSATVKLSSDVAKFAIFDMDDTTWNLDSGNGYTYGSKYTIANIKEELAGRILAGKGEGDNVFTATSPEMTIKLLYNNFNVAHHMYALAYGTDGNFGSLVNLYNPEMPESEGDDKFLSSESGYKFEGVTYEYGEGGDDEEPGDNTDLWTSNSVSQSLEFYKMYEMLLEVHDKGAGATKMWILKLDSINGGDVNYTQKTKFTNQLGLLFKDYATDQKPSSDANVLASFEGSSVPHSGSFTISDTPWAQNWSIGDVFAVVADFGNNVLGAKVCGIDSDSDWISICTVNSSNKPQL